MSPSGRMQDFRYRQIDRQALRLLHTLKCQRNADGAEIVGLRLLVEFARAENIGEGDLYMIDHQGQPYLGIEDDGLFVDRVAG